jgi:hypothetical protein
MPTYRLMNMLTDEGRKTVKERPDRIGEVNQELEGMGARVISDVPMMRLPARWEITAFRVCRRGPVSSPREVPVASTVQRALAGEVRRPSNSHGHRRQKYGMFQTGPRGGCRYEHSSALDIRQSIRDGGR